MAKKMTTSAFDNGPEKARFRKNSIVRYAYGNEFDGPRIYKVQSSDRSYLFGTTYTISNGVTTLTGVKEKNLTKAVRL